MTDKDEGSNRSMNNELNPPEDSFTRGFGYLFGILLSLIFAEYITNGLSVLSDLLGTSPKKGIEISNILPIATEFYIFFVIFFVGLIIILNQSIETFLWTLARPDKFGSDELIYELFKFSFHLFGIIALYGYVSVFTNINDSLNEGEIFTSIAIMFFMMNLFYAFWCITYEVQHFKRETGWSENRLAFLLNISFCILWILFIWRTNLISETTLNPTRSGLILIFTMLSYQVIYLLLWQRWYVEDLLDLAEE